MPGSLPNLCYIRFSRGACVSSAVRFLYTYFTNLLFGNYEDRRLLAKAMLTFFALTLAIRVLAQVMPYDYSIVFDIRCFRSLS
jgi:hypothetical protein